MTPQQFFNYVVGDIFVVSLALLGVALGVWLMLKRRERMVARPPVESVTMSLPARRPRTV